MNTEDIFQPIHIDTNPLNSMIAKKLPPDKALEKALSEVLNGMKLNYSDLPFYVVALETLTASLKNEMERKCLIFGKIMYEFLSKSTSVTTISSVERSDSET